MKHIPLTLQVLHVLSGMAYATSDMLFEQLKPETRGGLRDALSRLRTKHKFITTEGERHSINDAGREYLAKQRVVDTSSRQTFTPHVQAKATPMPEVRSVMTRPTWTPPRWEPVRPGADAHKACASRGIA